MTSDSNEKSILPFKPDCSKFLDITNHSLLNIINAIQNIRYERTLEHYLHDVDGDINVISKEIKKIIDAIEINFGIKLSIPCFK